jgi:hypothetical protein
MVNHVVHTSVGPAYLKFHIYYNLIALEVPVLYKTIRMIGYDVETKVKRGISIPGKTY